MNVCVAMSREVAQTVCRESLMSPRSNPQVPTEARAVVHFLALTYVTHRAGLGLEECKF